MINLQSFERKQIGIGALAAVAGAGTNILGSVLNYKAQKDTNKLNERMANNQNQMQDQQSRTQYQRAVTDMKAAGINPMMAMSNGGNSAMAGARAEARAPQLDLDKTVSSAIDATRLKKEFSEADARIKKDNASADAFESSVKLNDATAKVAKKNATILDAKMGAVREQAKLEAMRAKQNQDWVNYDNNVNRVGQTLGTINNALPSVKGLLKGGKSVLKPKHPKERRKKPSYNKKTGEIHDDRLN